MGRFFVLLIALPLFLFSSPYDARALTINFDDLSGAPISFAGASALRDRYESQGVLFDGPAGPTGNSGGAILNIATFPITPLSGLNALAFSDLKQASLSDGGKPVWPETLTFDTLWANVTIYVASTRTDMDHFSLTAYDSGGKPVVIGEADAKNDTWGKLSVSWAAGIKSVVLSMDKKGNDAFVADNLELTIPVVPEPGTMLLLGLGVIGLGILRSRT